MSIQSTGTPRHPRLAPSNIFAIIASAAICACGSGTGPSGEEVGSLEIGASTRELFVGETVNLRVTLLDPAGIAISNRAVTWSSSSETVATVRTGEHPDVHAVEVTGHSAGTATISATAGGKSASIQIRVWPTCTSPGDRSIGVDDTRAGVLGETDCLLSGTNFGYPWLRSLAQSWELDLASTTSLQIDFTSASFNSFLVITDTGMNPVAWNASFGTDARLVRTLAAGQYMVWASDADIGAGRSYQLSTRSVTAPSCTDPVGTVAVGGIVNGALGSDDCLLHTSWFADPWLLVVSAPTTFQVDLRSDSVTVDGSDPTARIPQFDTFLLVTDRSGGIIVVDEDGGEGLDSRLVHTFGPGEYLVVASSSAAGATGSYQLSVHPHPGMAAPSCYSSGTNCTLIATRSSSNHEMSRPMNFSAR